MTRRHLGSVALVAALVLPGSAALAGFAGTDVFLASVGRRAGAAGSSWYTTVWVHNPGTTQAAVQFFLLERDRDNTAAQPYNDVIQPGDTVRYDDAVATMFGVERFGAIRVVSDRRLVVNSRIYSQAEGESPSDTLGQFFAAVPAGFAIGAGESTQLLGAYQTSPKAESQFRYNFGFVETSGAHARVRVTAVDPTGAQVVAKDYDLRPLEARQLPLEDLLPGVDATNLRLSVTVTSGDGRVIAFGSGLANRSNDPSTFEMQFRDGLLAENLALAHDGSLVGDGTPAAPLAVANGGIESRHLATGAAVTGVNGAADEVTIAGGQGIAVSTVGSTVTVASAANAVCPECTAGNVFNISAQPATFPNPLFTVAQGKTRYVTSIHAGSVCEPGGEDVAFVWINDTIVLSLTPQNPFWTSGGGAPLVVGAGQRLQLSRYASGDCESTVLISGFEF